MCAATDSCSTIKRQKRIEDVNKALSRMEKKGFANSLHYHILKNKRDAIADGAKYTVKNIAGDLIYAIGSLIPECNMGFDKRTLPVRGKVKAKTNITRRGKEIIDLVKDVVSKNISGDKV